MDPEWLEMDRRLRSIVREWLNERGAFVHPAEVDELVAEIERSFANMLKQLLHKVAG